jgi:LPS sulfotransferase NodH
MQGILQSASPVADLDRIIAAGTTTNGVFGAKVHWGHWRYLGLSIAGQWREAQRFALRVTLERRSPPPDLPAALALLREGFSDLRPMADAHDLLQSRLPELRVVWLRRRNMVARAISHFRALRSGRWYMSQSGADADIAAGGPAPEFDFAEIHILNCLGQFHDEMWRRFFRARAIEPLLVNYEDLVEDRDATVRRVLAFAGVDAAVVPISAARSQRQSDAVSLQWEERYLRLTRSGGEGALSLP